MLTKREIFEKVAAHLIAQGMPARTSGGSCRYRTSAGLKCAVGCLIDDDKYTPVIEGQIPEINDRSVDLSRVLKASGVVMSDHDIIDMLRDLQALHDCNDSSVWQARLVELRAIYFPRNHKC